MARLEAVQPGETLARQVLPRLRSSILTAVVERNLDRAEPLLRQHIAHSVERLSAAPVPG